MSLSNDDILKEIPFSDIYKLRDLYENHIPYATHIYSFLNTALKWIKERPEQKFFTFLAPNGDWSDGTFFVTMKWACNDLLVFTLDKNCKQLYKSLVETNIIDWNERVIYFALHNDQRHAVLLAMEQLNLKIIFENKMHIWWLSKEKASELTFNCPEKYYIDVLKPHHAALIYELWPYGYKESVEYVTTFIEMNGGHGVFTKSGDKLVSWVLKNHLGTLGILQTVDEHKRRGLGSLIAKSLSKEIGLEGHNPVGTILINNVASQDMFRKIGFEILDACSFLGVIKP